MQEGGSLATEICAPGEAAGRTGRIPLCWRGGGRDLRAAAGFNRNMGNTMRHGTVFFLLLLLACALPAAAQRGVGALDPSPPTGKTVEEVIAKFAAKEAEFKAAREQYTYRQHVRVQTLEGGRVDGAYEQIVDISFDRRGRRVENVVFAPQSTLRRISMSPEDHADIEKRLPFVLTTEEIPLYRIEYAGRQRVDELDTYVFDIAPRQIRKGERYFEGRLWVDDRDFQIVKTQGRSVPDIRSKHGENLFPAFTTWREQVDGRYWFPTYTRADDVLKFTSGDVPIRIVVRYTNYQRFGADVRITFEGEELEKAEPPPPAEPPK
jgi:hypothetical protein